jgi:hypothetical protein
MKVLVTAIMNHARQSLESLKNTSKVWVEQDACQSPEEGFLNSPVEGIGLPCGD